MSTPAPLIAGEQAYVGSVAKRYEAERLKDFHWEVEQSFVAGFVTRLKEHTSILDVPWGSGRFAQLFVERGLNVSGVDISEDMLAASRELRGALLQNTRLLVANISQLPFGDREFKVATCFRMMHLIPPTGRTGVLRELFRVTADEVVIQTYLSDSAQGPPPALWRRALRRGQRILSRQPSWATIQTYPLSTAEMLAHVHEAGGSVTSRFELKSVPLKNVVFVCNRR